MSPRSLLLVASLVVASSLPMLVSIVSYCFHWGPSGACLILPFILPAEFFECKMKWTLSCDLFKDLRVGQLCIERHKHN
jgi:hypothetical protein